MRKGGIRRKLYRFTCGRPELHRKALQFCRSIEEVRRLLEGDRVRERRER